MHALWLAQLELHQCGKFNSSLQSGFLYAANWQPSRRSLWQIQYSVLHSYGSWWMGLFDQWLKIVWKLKW